MHAFDDKEFYGFDDKEERLRDGVHRNGQRQRSVQAQLRRRQHGPYTALTAQIRALTTTAYG